MLQYRTLPDPWNTNYNSVDNFILSQYSKFIATKMVSSMIEQNKYDYIIYLRSDVKYITPLPIQNLNLVNNNQILIPNFHLFGKYKFNDRFAICNNSNYKIYGNIYPYLLQISKQIPLHSETLIAEILNKNKIKFNPIKFYFHRVRANGNISKDT